MFKLRGYKQIVGIVVILIMANFLFVNFASADNDTITKEEAARAQTDRGFCVGDYKTKIQTISDQKYKAIWNVYSYVEDGNIIEPFPSIKCFIAAATFSDTGSPADVKPEIQAFDEKVKTVGVTKTQVQESVTKADAEKERSNAVSVFFGYIIKALAGIISSLLGAIAALAGKIMVATIESSIGFGDVQPPIVTLGWTIVRDVMNMMFILAMIVMSLGTILRIEKYNYKNILVKLILMALLVNFSLVIATTIISVFDVLIKMFILPNDFIELAKNFFNATWSGFLNTDGFTDSLIKSLAQIIFMLVAVIAFLALALLFLIRMIGLYFLLILSPIAYALYILPDTSEYAHKWWTTFFKYLIWGPVAMFFVRLAVILSNRPEFGGNQVGSEYNFIVLTGFLFGAVLVAKQAGMVGGEAIAGYGEKLMKGAALLPFGAAKMAGGAAMRSYSNRMFNRARTAELQKRPLAAALYKGAAFLNLPLAKKAWEARSHHLDEEVEGKAVGAMHDTLNRILPTEWHLKTDPLTGKVSLELGRKTNYGAIEYNRVIDKKAKEFNEAPLTEEQRVKLYIDAHHLDDKLAILRSIVMNNHQDGLAGAWGVDYEGTDFKQRIFDDLLHSGASKEQIGEQMNYISEISEANKKIRGLGSGVVDKDDVARASVDLTYFDNLAGDAERDTKIVSELKSLNIIDDQGEFADAEGEVKGTIKNYDDYLKVMKETGESGDKFKGQVLEHEIKAARAAKEAIKRLKRTDSEDVAKAIEPAGVAIQRTGKDGDGGFDQLSSEGNRILNQLNPSVGMAIPNMRRTQARAQTLVGGAAKEDGTIDYTAILDDTISVEENKKLRILVQTARSAPEVAAGFLSKSKLDKETNIKILELVNQRLQTVYKGKRKATKFLGYDEKRGEFIVSHSLPNLSSAPVSPPPPPSPTPSVTPSTPPTSPVAPPTSSSIPTP